MKAALTLEILKSEATVFVRDESAHRELLCMESLMEKLLAHTLSTSFDLIFEKDITL